MRVIESGAFSGTGITRLVLPDSVTQVDVSGLSDSLTSLRWTAGIPVLGYHFKDFTKLQSVVLPEGVTDLAGDYDFINGTLYNYGTFQNCTSLTSVSLPDSLTNIGYRAFYNCKKLTTLKLPEGVTSIGYDAFRECTALKELQLSAKLKTIGDEAFSNCQSLTTLELPEGLEAIGSSAFYGTKIENLELPDSVTQVGVSGLSDSLTSLRWTAGIPVLGDHFKDFTKLQSVVLPEGVTELNGTFQNCTNLTSVSLPDSLTTIAMPVNVAVSYRCNEELMFAEESIADIRQDAAEVETALKELSDEDWTNAGANLTEMAIDYDGDVPIPESLQNAVTERNALLNEYLALKEQLDDARQTVRQAIAVTDNKTSIHTSDLTAEIEKSTLPHFTVAEKIAEGYSVFRAGSAPDALVFYRITIDQSTGEVRQSIIDASGGDLNAVTSAFSALPEAPMTAQITDGYLRQSQLLPKDLDTGLVIRSAEAVDVTLPNASANPAGESFKNVLGSLQFLENETSGFVNIGGKLRDSELNALVEMDDFKDLLKKNWDDTFLRYEQIADTDPAEARRLETVLSNETKRIDKLNTGLNRAYDAHTKAWENFNAVEKNLKLLKPLGKIAPVLDVYNLVSDSIDLGDINKIYDKTADPDALLARNLLVCNLALTVFGLGCPVAIAFATAAAPVIIGLTAAGMVAALLSLALGFQTGDTVERVKSKYSGTGNPLKPAIDPSGFVYEAVLSNRLPDATVTCYEQVTKQDIYGESYTDVVIWDAAEYGQENPLRTDLQGQYAWDVPQGIWQVKAELPGYETAYSDWLTVPPPQLEVNLGLVSYAAPEISDVFAQPNAVEITFSKYMKADLLTADHVTVLVNGTPAVGTVQLIDAEASAENRDQLLARKIRFVPSQPLAAGDQVRVSASAEVRSYADVSVREDSRPETTVMVIPDELLAPQRVRLVYGGSGTISIQALPKNLAAGLTVQVSTDSELFVTAAESAVTLDDSGCAVIRITGKLPGETSIRLSMCGGRVLQTVNVLTLMPGETPELSALTMAQSYLVLEEGDTAVLQADTEPQQLPDVLCWSVEKGGEDIVMVDASGTVRAMNPGTAYVLVSAADGRTNLTARCRIDVIQKSAPGSSTAFSSAPPR